MISRFRAYGSTRIGASSRKGRGTPRLRPCAETALVFSHLFIMALFLFGAVLSPAAVSAATPAGTVISNTAAAAYTDGPFSGPIVRNSNTVTVTTMSARTPAVIELMAYAPFDPGAQLTPVPSSAAYSTSATTAGPFLAVNAPLTLGGAVIDLTTPVPLVAAGFYHAGEAAFIRLTDLDQNLDPAAAETVLVTVTNDVTGDSEVLRFEETGVDTGVFIGYIQTAAQPAAAGNGVLSIADNSRITASYVDPADSSDSVSDQALVNPMSKAFSSTTGQPLDGVSITLIDDATNAPAVVFGDDGAATFPSTVVTGMTMTDGNGKPYPSAPGQYRFPFIPAGTYRLAAVPPAGYKAPSTVATSVLAVLPGGPFIVADPASRGGAFTVNGDAAAQIDIPVDPAGNRLYLVKSASKTAASLGDFVQYKLSLQNTDTTAPVAAVSVKDVLPLGFRYRQGSTKINGLVAPEPKITSDGRSLTFTLGDIAAGATTVISYVTEISAGALPGTATNIAVATGTGAVSNPAKASLVVKEELFSGKAFIAGRVFADGCGNKDATGEGVEGIRLYLEDGTSVVTDKKGMYHFEGLNPGAHVVQVDLDTVSEKYEVLFCEENSRFAERAYSQFVDLQGGTLWRADFHLGLKPAATGEAGLELRSVLRKAEKGGGRDTVEYSVPISVGMVPVHNLRLTVMLPDGAVYQQGTSSLNAAPQPDPADRESALTFGLGDVPGDWEGTVRFNATVPVAGAAGELATRALLFFDSPGKKNERSPMADNLLMRKAVEEHKAVPDIVLHPRFAVLSAELSAQDRKSLDRLVKDLKKLGVKQITVTGHTDSDKINGRGMKKFKDNYLLSQARAETVGRYIAAALKLPLEQVTFIGKGPDEPVDTNKTAKGKARNRRVELQVRTEAIVHSSELTNEKDASGVKTVATTGLRPGELWSAPAPEKAGGDMPGYTPARLEGMEPGLAWLWPGEGRHPPIPSVKLAVKHEPARALKLYLNGVEVDALHLDGTVKRQDNLVAASTWRGVHVAEGDNLFEAVQYDQTGAETARIKLTIHYSSPPVKAEFLPAQSRLAADGKTPPVIAVRLTDKDGHPAREGVIGEYSLDPPYIPLRRVEDLRKDPLTAPSTDRMKYEVGPDGTALIELQPTTRTGEAVVRLNLVSGPQEVRAWLKPDYRHWILVGLAEGTVGYNTLSKNMVSAAELGEEDKYYRDGRVAFYAKGAIKGEWLLTIAYDSDRHPEQDPRAGLHQAIDPNTYYTLYGDATLQRPDAASARALYLKIERDQFYALFGDYDTGLTVTELSRYSRQLNGMKSELKSDHFDYTLFASRNDQTFVKDELRGDGTSGLYRLSRRNIILNSETVVIETRDRFKSEVVLSSQPMSRYLDYAIDYDAGTLWFKAPVFSRDANLNPIFIVVRYELFDADGDSYTYGGRGAARVLDNKLEIGATGIHEEQGGGEGDLTGIDATIRLDDKTKFRAEAATTKSDESGTPVEGNAYLAELIHRSENIEGRAYVRELESGFGLGQQSAGETGTRKTGVDLLYRLDRSLSIQGDAFRQENLLTDAVRTMVELQGRYAGKRYELFGGARSAEDSFADGVMQGSDQIFLGGRYQVTDRLSASLRHDQSLGGENANADFPTRTTLGADFRLSNSAALFAAQELTNGDVYDTSTSRLGLRTEPWAGGQIGSTIEQQAAENGERLFSTLGLKQTWQATKRWTLDAGLDRSQTIREREFTTTLMEPRRFNENVPPASGGADFTAVSFGAGYRAEAWSWTGRGEDRRSDDEKKWGVFTGVNGEVREGLGLAAGAQAFRSAFTTGARTVTGDVRLGIAYRPREGNWIVLDRLDYLVEERKNGAFSYDNRRIVNNLNVNYKLLPAVQAALQYACKYGRETIDNLDYRGYTDLAGLELRYDLTKKWDIGLRGRMLHSWNVDEYQYGAGVSVGYNFVTNVLMRVGYNLTGFTDKDFSKADFTAQGPFISLSLKFDQATAREAVKRLTGM